MAPRNTKPTKDKIIDAAFGLFYRQGYNQTTIDQVIEQSGVSRPTVYSHFSSKEDLCLEYLKERRTKELDVLKENARKAKSPKERYLAVVKTMADVLWRTDYRGCGFFNMISEIPDINHRLVKEARGFVDSFREIIKDGVLDIKTSGPKYKNLDVDHVAEAYYLLVGGAIMGSQEYHEKWPAKRAIKIVEQLIEK